MIRSIIFSLCLFIPSQVFAGPVNFVCHYPVFSNESGMKKYSKHFQLKIYYDPATSQAKLIGDGGTAKLKPVLNKDKTAITFIEVTPSGNVMTITIDTTSKSVYSRNATVNGQLVASQSYGSCKSLSDSK